mmetsp:Transcript_19221/g.35153  ORF Transcript_19221/g.35153 Transcript_19221/m.35153 type:complete len:252 (-) Transcript_19221:3875-4630(-)
MKNFKPSLSNLGGRKTIVDHMNNHYVALMTVKPTISIRDQPKTHIDSISKPSHTRDLMKQDKQLEEVRETFKRVANRKSPKIDAARPETFSMAEKLSQYRNRRKKAGWSEHWSNIKHMQRRINDIGSVQERKKNPFDPITNPALFYTRADSPKLSKTAISRFVKRVTAHAKQSSVYEMPKERSFKSRSSPRPTQSNDSLNLKEKLLEEIVSSKIYTDDGLGELFERARKKYRDIPKEEVEEAIAYVLRELD